MDELQILATLIQHADRQIDAAANMFLVVMGVMATFTMTQAYEKKFNVFLKILLSVGLTVVLLVNRETIIEQMHIYNALIENFPDDVEPWKTLFGDHSVYHAINTTSMWLVHGAASILIHVLIWHKELNTKFGHKLQVWFQNWKTKRRHKA